MMIGYAGMRVPIDYLLAASLMAIPGGILFARILSPATEESQVTFDNLSFTGTPPKSIIEAAASGAMTGLKIAAGVATVVMAFVAIIALINGIIGGVGGWFGFSHATLEGIFGWVLAPLAWIMGVDWSDATLAGSLIGQKLAINEFVAYLHLSPYLQTADSLDVKTIAIISFALCGFANFGSIGVVVGAFSAIAPQRAPEIAQLGLAGTRGSHALQSDECHYCGLLYRSDVTDRCCRMVSLSGIMFRYGWFVTEKARYWRRGSGCLC